LADAIEDRMQGCGPEQALELFELALKMLKAKRPDPDVVRGYVSLMGDYPRDLLMKSVKAVLLKETYHMLPTPAAMVAVAEAEMVYRRAIVFKLKHAHRRLAVARMFHTRKAPSTQSPPGPPRCALRRIP
jgi:hypothetical protein